ncbi:MAG: SH3 domain-containing protein [Caldilineae bacterium]|nr:SH3 domain-containing protein [Anaerolineae bacterium]MCB9152859.1 SH3 domain-containing protein [Caldilineae bacterium]
MRSPRWIVLVALAVLLVMPGCALVNLLVDYPTPTPPPQRALRPTFTPTATREAPVEAVVQAPEATPAPPAEQPQEPPAEQTDQQATPVEQPTEPPAEPTATPTPFLVVANGVANARSGPGTDYEQIGELPQGAQLALIARNEAGDWWQACCMGDQPVWVFGDLVTLQGSVDGIAVAANVPPPPSPTPSPTPQPEVVVTNPRVNVRSLPSTDAPVLGQVLNGARLQIVGRDETGDWWQVCCFEGSAVWIADEVVRTEGPLELVALSPDLPTATPVPPTATPEAAAAATTPEPTAEPGDLSFSETSETFPFNQDYFRVAAKVVNAAGTPLDGYYLRILNETTGQQWISDPSEDVWQVTAPNAAFADYREANATFDTRGKAPLAASAYAVWLVDGRGHQLSPVVRLAQNDDEFQWLYVVFTSQ